MMDLLLFRWRRFEGFGRIWLVEAGRSAYWRIIRRQAFAACAEDPKWPVSAAIHYAGGLVVVCWARVRRRDGWCGYLRQDETKNIIVIN
jgi:hypothetical protein